MPTRSKELRKAKRVLQSTGLGLGILLPALILVTTALSVKAQAPVILPIEVAGEDGTTTDVTLAVPAGRVGAVKSLWMQIHGLEYADMVSVQINSSVWLSLNNESVTVADPGKSYGGFGGGFATLKLTLPLPSGTVVGESNTFRFRFNHSNGTVSGFRVLAFNFLAADGQNICPSSMFAQENPDTWVAPLRDSQSVAAGQTLWKSAALKASSLPSAQSIRAHCADCHTRDGRDLKYFNFSNNSIIARSRFHGLSSLEGRQIASYIRSLPFPNPGGPWNPPYQPGPGLDAQPVSHWAAGAGLNWVLDRDADTLGFIFAPDNQKRDGETPSSRDRDVASLITPAVFRPDGNLNPREIPISLQLPDWNHWLPRVHPLDAWGSDFLESDFSQLAGLRAALTSLQGAKPMSPPRIAHHFNNWSQQRARLLKKPLALQAAQSSPELAVKIHSTQLWQLVKTWELTQEFGLEGDSESRTWMNTIPAETAPDAARIPDSPNGVGGSALANEYFDNSWYELQLLLNNGNHQHDEKRPIDWVYFMGRFLDLQKESHRPEPGRVLVSVIKAMQSTDPRIGPENEMQGWRPTQNIEPTIMVSRFWAPVFEPLSSEVKKAVTESLLEAWLNKNAQYPVSQYFSIGRGEHRYKASASLGAITGGTTWEAAQQFQKAGVRPHLVRRLTDWGKDYSDTGRAFQLLRFPRRFGSVHRATPSQYQCNPVQLLSSSFTGIFFSSLVYLVADGNLR